MKLKPCPLCAAPAKAGRHALVFWHVKCTQCMLTLKDMHTSELAAGNAWNLRLTEQDRRNASPKRWSKSAYFEIVNQRTGEQLSRWLADNDDEDKRATAMKEYGFHWDHYDFARRMGVETSYSGIHCIPTELRYYDEVY